MFVRFVFWGSVDITMGASALGSPQCYFGTLNPTPKALKRLVHSGIQKPNGKPWENDRFSGWGGFRV